MKDKNLRKILGIHGFEDFLCGCDFTNGCGDTWIGELPMLWRELSKVKANIEELRVLFESMNVKKHQKILKI